MKILGQSLYRRLFKDERGQTLVLMAVALTGLMSTAALSIDAGRAFYSYRALQAYTQAAALAGAESLPATSATTAATNYSAISGDKNANTNLPNVSMVSGYPKTVCLTTLTNMGMSCVAPANANAVQVKEQVTVPMFFAEVFGKKTLTLNSTATAAMRGSASTPYNVAIIVDTTASMNDNDSDSQCTSTRLTCALGGVQVLLKALSPCASSLATCGAVTTGNVTNSVDRVALFTFPNATIGTMTADYDCLNSNPTIKPYTFPASSATSYAPSGTTTPTYLVVNYSSDYRTSDTTTSLSGSSNIVKAVGGASNCTGMAAPGGESTYYAGVIYAAEASLVAEKVAFPGSQNVLIIISDGDAEATSSDMASGYNTNGTYASTKQECAQAVQAGQNATNAGTRVYAVAYGAESSGCSTDTSPSITPCQTMQQIASASQDFFSDYTQSGSSSSCISSSQPTSNLNQIFTDIAGDLTVSRLIPNNTT